MKRRQWDSKTTAKVVLEGLPGKPVSELLSQYQVSQTQYYQWRDKFLSEAGGPSGFRGQGDRRRRVASRHLDMVRVLFPDTVVNPDLVKNR